MIASKRRPASTPAVSRKVEGIEPRRQGHRKDDAFNNGGSQHLHNRKGEEVLAILTFGLNPAVVPRQP